MDLHKEVSLKDLKEIIKKICCADRKKIILFFSLSALIVNSVLWAKTGKGSLIGYEDSNMDSYFFIPAAKMLISDLPEFFRSYGSMPYYWFYIVFLGIGIALFGENYAIISFFQMIIHSASAPVLYLAAEKITNDRRIPFLSTLIYIFCFCASRWNGIITSDFLATSFLPVCMFFLFSFLNESDTVKRKKDAVPLIISLLLFFTMRTNAVAFIAGCAAVIIYSFGRKARIIAGVLLLSGAAGAFIFFLASGNDKMHSIADNFNYFFMLYRNGYVVFPKHIYIYTQYAEPGTFPYYYSFAEIIIYRFFYYWTSIDFLILDGKGIPDTAYVMMNYVPLAFIFFFMFLGMLIAKTRRDTEAYNIRILSGLIWLTCFVQIISEIQSDWRYRDIILPMSVIICAYGIIKLCDMIKTETDNDLQNKQS